MMVIMDTSGLVLVGSSALSPSDKSPHPSQTFTYQKPSAEPSSDRLDSYFEQNRTRPATASTVKTSPTKRYKKSMSYVDESLFGTKSGGGDSYHGYGNQGRVNKNAYQVNSRPASQMTEYQGRSYTDRPAFQSRPSHQGGTTRPTSARTTSSKTFSQNLKRKPGLFKHTPSYVDEMLFGPKLAESDFPSPWKEKKQTKAHRFDYTNYKTQHREVASSSGRSQRYKHSASFVDDSLFGPKSQEPTWEAPWGEKEKKTPINIYDAYQHKVCIEHNDVDIVRPKSTVPARKVPQSSNPKPVWR